MPPHGRECAPAVRAALGEKEPLRQLTAMNEAISSADAFRDSKPVRKTSSRQEAELLIFLPGIKSKSACHRPLPFCPTRSTYVSARLIAIDQLDRWLPIRIVSATKVDSGSRRGEGSPW